MKKLIVTILCLSCISSTLLAGEFGTGDRIVSRVWQYAESHGYFYLDGYSCPDKPNDPFRVNGSFSQHKTVMSILMTALVSDKKVNVRYNVDANGYCVLNSVQLIRN